MMGEVAQAEGIGALPQRKVKGYGWRPGLPDPRDYTFDGEQIARQVGLEVPGAVDLRAAGHLPPVYDQGQLGSCTANALAGAWEYEAARQGFAFDTPSRLFIYYGERSIEGTIDQDAGAMIADGAKVLATLGAPSEADWPYDISQFAAKPPDRAFADGAQRLAIEYRRVNLSLHSKKCCVALGTPIVFGFTVWSSFESSWPTPNVMPIPNPASEQVLGGHAVVIVGYDDARQLFVVRNSWGAGWGEDGYFYMPYAFALDNSQCSDFWTIMSIEEPRSGAGLADAAREVLEERAEHATPYAAEPIDWPAEPAHASDAGDLVGAGARWPL